MGAYQLKITIKGSKPPIWRRILVPQGITFETLHQMIQTAFCWSDDHLYQFEFRSEGIRVSADKEAKASKFEYRSADENIDALVSGTKKFTYTYDFGDNWEHVILVEETDEEYSQQYAQVLKFKGDVIPQDCGGLEGYYKLLETSSDKLEVYDLSEVNRRLKQSEDLKSSDDVCITDIYECYDKNSVAEIAKRHNMNGYSKLKKEELVKQTISYILNKEVMRNYFLCVRDSEMKLFESVAAGNSFLPSFEESEMDYLYAGGYVTSGAEQQYMVSEEVLKAYAELNTPQFQAERERLSKIGDYLCAANSLYAITPPSVVLETFNKYEDKKLTLEELMKAYEQLLPYRLLVQYTDGNFVDAALVEQNSYQELSRIQKKVPYYIPTQLEIRFMADNAGFLMLPELTRLSEFLTGTMNVADNMIPYILRQVQAEISMGGQLQEVIDDLAASGIHFAADEQMEAFASIIMDVWNHTRMVLNRGHKPYEMVMKGLEESSVQRRNTQKIYPNSPCTCGSGKKYKKCCGKGK